MGTANDTIKAYMDQNESPGITFEGEKFQRPAQSFKTATPKIVQWVIRYSGGLVKDEKQANYVLIGFVVVTILLASFLMFSGGGGGGAEIKAPPGQRIIYPENGPPRLEEGVRP